jgi:hypothetical protein
MAHFAQLNDQNIVLQVIVIHNNDCLDDMGMESETKGIEFCNSLIPGNWVQTSYNAKIRKNYAGIGFTYDQQRDAFIAPKPFTSWILNETTCQWEAPVPYPNDEKSYVWDEESLQWIEVPLTENI